MPGKQQSPSAVHSLPDPCLQPQHPAQERFAVSACSLSHSQLIAEVFECRLFSPPRQNRGCVLLPLLSSPRWIFPSLIVSVFMLSKHQPGMSLAPPAAGQSTPALMEQPRATSWKITPWIRHHCFKVEAAPSTSGSRLWGGCSPSGHVWGARDGLAPTLEQSTTPWAAPGGFLQHLRGRSGALTKAPVGMDKRVCREGFICRRRRKRTPKISALKCVAGQLRTAPNGTCEHISQCSPHRDIWLGLKRLISEVVISFLGGKEDLCAFGSLWLDLCPCATQP